MVLRKHPALKGIWPPSWAGTYSGADKMPIGEQGVLESVQERRIQNQDCIVLRIEFDGNTHSGVLPIPDPKSRAEILRLLKSAIGKSMKAVGDLEI